VQVSFRKLLSRAYTVGGTVGTPPNKSEENAPLNAPPWKTKSSAIELLRFRPSDNLPSVVDGISSSLSTTRQCP